MLCIISTLPAASQEWAKIPMSQLYLASYVGSRIKKVAPSASRSPSGQMQHLDHIKLNKKTTTSKVLPVFETHPRNLIQTVNVLHQPTNSSSSAPKIGRSVAVILLYSADIHMIVSSCPAPSLINGHVEHAACVVYLLTAKGQALHRTSPQIAPVV